MQFEITELITQTVYCKCTVAFIKKTGQWSTIEVDVYLVVTYVVNKAPIYMS